jgi:hypothetical protein
MKEIVFTASIPKEAHCYRISSAMLHRHGGLIRCWSCKKILDIGAIIYSPSHAKGIKSRCLACSISMGVLVLEMPDEFNICKCGHSARSVDTFRRHVHRTHGSDEYSTWLVETGVVSPQPVMARIGLDGTVERIEGSEK